MQSLQPVTEKKRQNNMPLSIHAASRLFLACWCSVLVLAVIIVLAIISPKYWTSNHGLFTIGSSTRLIVSKVVIVLSVLVVLGMLCVEGRWMCLNRRRGSKGPVAATRFCIFLATSFGFLGCVIYFMNLPTDNGRTERLDVLAILTSVCFVLIGVLVLVMAVVFENWAPSVARMVSGGRYTHHERSLVTREIVQSSWAWFRSRCRRAAAVPQLGRRRDADSNIVEAMRMASGDLSVWPQPDGGGTREESAQNVVRFGHDAQRTRLRVVNQMESIAEEGSDVAQSSETLAAAGHSSSTLIAPPDYSSAQSAGPEVAGRQAAGASSQVSGSGAEEPDNAHRTGSLAENVPELPVPALTLTSANINTGGDEGGDEGSDTSPPGGDTSSGSSDNSQSSTPRHSSRADSLPDSGIQSIDSRRNSGNQPLESDACLGPMTQEEGHWEGQEEQEALLS